MSDTTDEESDFPLESGPRQKRIPLDCVQWNHQVDTISDQIDTFSYLRCMPGDVYHPYSFFVSLVEFWNPLEDLMADIQVKMKAQLNSTDARLKKKLNVDADNLIPGLYIMARHQHEWHRAIILKKLSNNIFQVFLIDYGTERNRTLYRLKYMPKSILEQLKPQAIECRLQLDSSRFKEIDWASEKAVSRYIQGLFNEKILGVLFNEREVYFDERCKMNRSKWVVNVNVLEGSADHFCRPNATAIAVLDVVRQLVRQFSDKFQKDSDDENEDDEAKKTQ